MEPPDLESPSIFGIWDDAPLCGTWGPPPLSYGYTGKAERDYIAKSTDPLTNPAIALEDSFFSFTPGTLDEMVAQQKNAAMRKRTRFLDLPHEIRDDIYGHLLRPECGVPMDFAACNDCQHETGSFLRRQDYWPHPPREALQWFASEWRRMKHQLGSLVLVCSQISIEAAEVFFEQPFRFTSDLGWVMLYHFLDLIGPKYRAMLKDITVCHPGFSVLPAYRPRRQSLWHGLYDRVFEDHLGLFGLGACLQKLEQSPSEYEGWINVTGLSYPKRSQSATWKSQGMFDGPVTLLSEANELRRLTLVLPHFQRFEDQASFSQMDTHPVHEVIWPQGDQLKLQIVHLIDSEHNCRARTKDDLCLGTMCLEELHGKPITFTNEDGIDMIHVPEVDSSSKVTTRQAEAQDFFASTKKLGWEVVEYMHDHRGHYPVKPKDVCTNKAICNFLKYINPGREIKYCCPGNYTVQIDHEGLELAERRRKEDSGLGRLRRPCTRKCSGNEWTPTMADRDSQICW